MKKELQDKLYKDFPSLYQQKDLSMTHSCMAFGIETGDGWFDLIYELSEKLSKVSPECQAAQVKEKFGTLRFYVDGANDEAYDLISEYEAKSANTCEQCGTTENVKQTQDWIVTLCPECMKEYYKKRGIEYDDFMSKSMSKRIKVQKGDMSILDVMIGKIPEDDSIHHVISKSMSKRIKVQKGE